MIIVQLIGGLGNQLFQYAMARRISIINNEPIKLNIFPFQQYKLHNYSLKHFNIVENYATIEEINALFAAGRVVREPYFHFDPQILNAPGDIYLDGYWQTEKYFKDIEETIRTEFLIKTPAELINLTTANNIMDSNSISLHIRRVDYVTNPAANKIHGVCSMEYYRKAIIKMTSVIHEPHFYIFSDDIKWAQENVNIDYPTTFVSQNGPDKNYEDLRLMSLCKHHIIANSTFSWWGAWLSTNKNKIVIAPNRWFNATDKDTKDVIPENWFAI